MVLFLGIGPPFVNPGDCPILSSPGFTLVGGHRHCCQRLSRSGGALPLSGSCPLDWGDGVGHCHDVADHPGKCLFISLLYPFWRENFTLFLRVWFSAEFAGS